jgi:hypothetical protein
VDAGRGRGGCEGESLAAANLDPLLGGGFSTIAAYLVLVAVLFVRPSSATPQSSESRASALEDSSAGRPGAVGTEAGSLEAQPTNTSPACGRPADQ